MPDDDVDAIADRLGQMLDVAAQAIREGDVDGAVLAMMEAMTTANRLPVREIQPEAICSPDTKRRAPEENADDAS